MSTHYKQACQVPALPERRIYGKAGINHTAKIRHTFRNVDKSIRGNVPCTVRVVIRATRLTWGRLGGQDRLPGGEVFVQMSEGKDRERDL